MNKTTNVQSSHDLDVDATANDCQTSFSNGGYLHEWVVYTKNARLHSDAELTELLGEMQSLNDSWDVVLFSETRGSAEMTILSGGHRLYSSHQQTSCAGVAVLVHVRHCANIQKVATINERLMYFDVQTSSKTIRFIAVYVPHAGYPDDDLQRVYDQLHHVLDEARTKSHGVFVGGDFNTQLHVGTRGGLLQHLLHMYQLYVADGGTEHAWTVCSSMGVRRRIDFILHTRNITQYSCFAFWPIRSVGFEFGSLLCLRSLQTCRGPMQEKVKTASQTQMVVQGVCAEIPSCNCTRFTVYNAAKLRRHRVLCGSMCQCCGQGAAYTSSNALAAATFSEFT